MNQEHISRQFDADLEGLRTRVLAMGGLVEQQVMRAMDELESGDMASIEQVIATDRLVNRHEVELDEACNNVIARRRSAHDHDRGENHHRPRADWRRGKKDGQDGTRHSLRR